jgi:TM2 domain-containing membrane protein YozV
MINQYKIIKLTSFLAYNGETITDAPSGQTGSDNLLKVILFQGGYFMKSYSKATLLSAFVFPGLGQLYLKRYWQGLVIIIGVVAGMGYIVWQATVLALGRVDSLMQSDNVKVKELTDIMASKSAVASVIDDIIFIIIICCWIISIADAYVSGKRKYLQDTSSDQT